MRYDRSETSKDVPRPIAVEVFRKSSRQPGIFTRNHRDKLVLSFSLFLFFVRVRRVDEDVSFGMRYEDWTGDHEGIGFASGEGDEDVSLSGRGGRVWGRGGTKREGEERRSIGVRKRNDEGVYYRKISKSQ